MATLNAHDFDGDCWLIPSISFARRNAPDVSGRGGGDVSHRCRAGSPPLCTSRWITCCVTRSGLRSRSGRWPRRLGLRAPPALACSTSGMTASLSATPAQWTAPDERWPQPFPRPRRRAGRRPDRRSCGPMASLATSATRRERSHARPPGYHDPSALERVPELPIGRVVRRRALAVFDANLRCARAVCAGLPVQTSPPSERLEARTGVHSSPVRPPVPPELAPLQCSVGDEHG